MQVLLIDNYDSFTYNLFQLLEECGAHVTVMKNDKINWAHASSYHKVVLSPGPGIPSEAGLLMPFIDAFHQTTSMLGICLGHQAIAQYFGGKLNQLDKIRHGHQNLAKISDSHHLFEGLSGPIQIGHYHSWIIETPLPECLVATLYDEEGHLMAIKHVKYSLHGLQFHPESVMTPQGKIMIKNWLKNP